MDLGKRIFDLRKEKNLSQGELAEMLDVSRQSISKWETNASTPELDKILKLSEIFGISLDGLIKGTEETHCEINKNTAEAVNKEKSLMQRIVGVILLCTGLIAFLIFSVLGGFSIGVLYSSPFISCGIICLVFKRRVLLWCSWDVFFLIDAYLAYATSISRGFVLLTMRWTNEMNFARLNTAWASLICLIFLIIATLISFKKFIFKPNRKKVIIIGTFLLFAVFLMFITHFYAEGINRAVENREYKYFERRFEFYRFISFITEWAKISSFVTLLVTVIGFVKYKRENK